MGLLSWLGSIPRTAILKETSQDHVRMGESEICLALTSHRMDNAGSERDSFHDSHVTQRRTAEIRSTGTLPVDHEAAACGHKFTF